MGSEEALKVARDALASQRYFDGIQAVNAALDALEGQLTATCADLQAEKQDILRTPQAFLDKAKPKMRPAQQQETAELFSVRAELLVGLGAAKRALVDVESGLQLVPDSEAMKSLKKVVEEKLAAGDEAAGDGEKVPVTIITGFLGSGKTTLLNHILQEHHGKKIAVIENEFGEVGIDDALLNTKGSVTEENIVEMNNGCICCTVRGDLIAGLKKLHKQSAGKGKPLDAIIIETTGLADPAPVAQTFFADDFVQAHMQLDGILTLVDAKHVMEHLREEKPDGIVNEAVEQVAFADRLLLNKIDLVTLDYLEDVRAEIRSINETAQIRQTQNSVVDMDFILGIRAFSLDKVLEQVSENFLDAEEEHGRGRGGGHGHEGHGGGHACDDADCGDPSHGHGEGGAHGGGHGHGHEEACHSESCEHPSHKKSKKPRHAHDYRVTSVGLTTDKEIREDKLDELIGWLMKEKGPDLYRSKGVFAVKGRPQKFVFHAVHMQSGGSFQDPWKEGEKRSCKMVFIGKNLNRAELTAKFEGCLVK